MSDTEARTSHIEQELNLLVGPHDMSWSLEQVSEKRTVV